MYECMYTCMYNVYIYIYIHISLRTHVYIYTHSIYMHLWRYFKNVDYCQGNTCLMLRDKWIDAKLHEFNIEPSASDIRRVHEAAVSNLYVKIPLGF